MQISQVFELPARWKAPFIVLLVLIVLAWSVSIYVGALYETHGGELITKKEVEMRSQKAKRNNCYYVNQHVSNELRCSELSESQNLRLNEFLKSSDGEYLIESYGDMLEAAKEASDNYIREGVFIIELGGGVIYIVVVASSIAFTAVCILVAVIVLFICLPVFLKSDDKDKAKRAGGVVKTCLGFIIASGTTLISGFVISSALL